jgi:glycosyltransferase involved in cell wall biosynthesis
MTIAQSPLCIAHVSATFPPYYGGTGNVCYHNARVLASRGHQVHVHTAAWPGEPDDPSGVVVHRYRPLVRVGNAPVLPQLLGLRRASLIHLHHPFYAGSEFVALSGRPYVVTYHQDVAREGMIGLAASLHDRTVGRLVIRRAARLCPTTLDYIRHSAIAEQADKLGDKVVAIPNGVDVERFMPAPVDLAVRQKYGLPEDGIVVLFVGAMDQAHYFKGVPTLLKALARVPSAFALLVGEGDLRSQYERLSRELGLGSRTVFTGRIPAHELPGAYRAATMVVLPSETQGEAFGMVLLEGMASARPVIATDLPGVRSVVSDGNDGFLVPAGNTDALANAISSMAQMTDSAREILGVAGRQKVEAAFSWERIGERLEALYLDVLSEWSANRAN